MTIADIGEFGLIRRIGELLPDTASSVAFGDDAAVVDMAGPVVAGVDAMVAGRHYKPEWSSGADVGHRAAAAAMADIAAMGGRCTALLVSLSLPAQTEVSWVTDLMTGISEEAAELGAAVVGGDLTGCETTVVSVTALGTAQRPVTRSGARPGDIVAIAGRQGWAAAGLTVLSRGFRSPRALVQAYQRPRPSYDSGPAAAAAGASAMIDVSDGLLADVQHIARSSGVLIDLDSSAVPVADQLSETSSAFNVDPLTWVLAGGDDHALIATFPAGSALPGMFTVIGRAIEPSGSEPGVAVDGRLWGGQSGGHEHFR